MNENLHESNTEMLKNSDKYIPHKFSLINQLINNLRIHR